MGKTISISPGISNGEILKLKDEIYECARSFRQDAILLMQLMSDKFSIDLEKLDGLYELKFKKRNKQPPTVAPPLRAHQRSEHGSCPPCPQRSLSAPRLSHPG